MISSKVFLTSVCKNIGLQKSWQLGPYTQHLVLLNFVKINRKSISVIKETTVQYIAFLRGINIGGRRSISMSEQKQCFELMGFTQVQVILQTGNILFNSEFSIPNLIKMIESQFSDQFNYPAKVMVLSIAQLKQIDADYPFPRGGENIHDYIIFLSHPLEWPDIPPYSSDESILIQETVVYWKVTKGLTLKSQFSKLLSKAKYKNFNTVRNINTVDRVLKAAPDSRL